MTKGQGLVEYALILVLVGPAIGNIFSNLVSNL